MDLLLDRGVLQNLVVPLRSIRKLHGKCQSGESPYVGADDARLWGHYPIAGKEELPSELKHKFLTILASGCQVISTGELP